MNQRTSPQSNRRGLLAAAAAAATAAVAAGKALSGTRAEAANGDPIIIGGARVGTSTTYLYPGFNDDGFLVWNSSEGGSATGFSALMGSGLPPFPDTPRNAAFYAYNNVGGGAGLMAVVTKQFGIGVHSRATAFNSTPVYAEATGGSSAAIEAKNASGPAIIANGEHYGLQSGARNQFGVGVQGYGPAKGVEGMSDGSSTGIGVAASSSDGTALRVLGSNAFSQSGKGVIPAGKRNVTVKGAKVKDTSGVLATLNTSPPPGIWIQFARAVAPDKVVIILNQKTTKAITFTYFVVDHAEP